MLWGLYNWGYSLLRNLRMIPFRGNTWQGNLGTRTCHHPALWVVSSQLRLSLSFLILWTSCHCWEYLSRLPLQPRLAQVCRQHHGLGGEQTWSHAFSLPLTCCMVGRILRWSPVSHTLCNLPTPLPGCGWNPWLWLDSLPAITFLTSWLWVHQRGDDPERAWMTWEQIDRLCIACHAAGKCVTATS